MGARIPPNGRPRRGGFNCEFCGRAVPSEAALHSHQASLHSQALKEKARSKLVAAKPSKVQKPEPRKILVKKVKPKVETTDAKTPLKKLSTDQSITKTSTAKAKAETPKAKTENLKPETDISKPKTDVSKPKVEKADNLKPKTDISQPKTEVSKPKVEKSVISKLKVEKLAAKSEEKSYPSPKMEKKGRLSSSTPGKLRKVEYKCPKCEKLFHVLFVAQKHIQKHHCVNSKGVKVAQNSPDIIQPIVLELCIYCNEMFSKPHDCPNRPDPSLLSYDCLGCEQQFKSNKLFDLHVADVHGDQSVALFFHSEEEFVNWKGEMESQTACEYMLMGKYNSKQVYRCSEHADSDKEDSVLLCPSSIIVTKCLKGLKVHFFSSHYEHEFKKYKLTDQYKTFTITDLIQQAGSANGDSDDDLYLQFKTLMESIVLEAAKINIGTLKSLMSSATDMMTILQDYDEDEEVEMIGNRSTISISTSNTSIKDEDSSESLPKNRKRGIEENGTDAKKVKKSVGETKILVKSAGKKSSTFSLADDKDSDKILKELDSGDKANKETKLTQSPSFNDSYKNFIMNERPIGKKKNVVKTKMGQFKGPSPKKVVKRHSIGSISITKDIEYEVRERDDDCNILVLKI